MLAPNMLAPNMQVSELPGLLQRLMAHSAFVS